jgi:hypothetical protein
MWEWSVLNLCPDLLGFLQIAQTWFWKASIKSHSEVARKNSASSRAARGSFTIDAAVRARFSFRSVYNTSEACRHTCLRSARTESLFE